MALEWLDMYFDPARKGDGYYFDNDDWEVNIQTHSVEKWMWWCSACEQASELIEVMPQIDGYAETLEDAKRDSLAALFKLKNELRKYIKSLTALEVQLMIDK